MPSLNGYASKYISQEESERTIKVHNRILKQRGSYYTSSASTFLDPLSAGRNLIDPEKDVDGFHPLTMGRGPEATPQTFYPCTPKRH